MNEVLSPDETTSKTFHFRLPQATLEEVSVQIITFPDPGVAWPGGTWKLQMLTPDGNWTDYGQEWDDFGATRFYAVAGAGFRLTGGNAGARAYATNVG